MINIIFCKFKCISHELEKLLDIVHILYCSPNDPITLISASLGKDPWFE